MDEYIWRSYIRKMAMFEMAYTMETETDAAVVLRMIDDAPAADVAPVVHSYWEGYSCSQYMGTDECGEPKWRDGRFYVCHNDKCRRKTVIKSNFCPNCGAKMDGGADDASV